MNFETFRLGGKDRSFSEETFIPSLETKNEHSQALFWLLSIMAPKSLNERIKHTGKQKLTIEHMSAQG